MAVIPLIDKDDQLSIDIDCKQNHSDAKVSILKKILYKFFYSKTYTLRSGDPFTIKSIRGPFSEYELSNINLVDNLSVTLINAKLDERPFVLCLEKTNATRVHYGLRDRNVNKWEPMLDLNETDEETKDLMLLHSIKDMFSSFFATEIIIKEDHSHASHKNIDNEYKVYGERHFFGEFDRCLYKPKTVFSISKVSFGEQTFKFDGDIKFVKEFYVYHSVRDSTTPIIIETYDYEIGDEIPYYNYYRPLTIHGEKWIGVECSTKLTRPKCKSDLQRIVNEIVMEFRDHPISLVLDNNYLDNFSLMKKTICGVPLLVQNRIRDHFELQIYGSKVNKTFFVEKVLFRDVIQKIDLRSRELRTAYSFNITQNGFTPVILAFKLGRSSLEQNSKFIWFKVESIGSKVWKRFEFDANPYVDSYNIEQMMRILYESEFANKSWLQSSWVFVSAVGTLVGVLAGIMYSARMVVLAARLFNRFRRQ